MINSITFVHNNQSYSSGQTKAVVEYLAKSLKDQWLDLLLTFLVQPSTGQIPKFIQNQFCESLFCSQLFCDQALSIHLSSLFICYSADIAQRWAVSSFAKYNRTHVKQVMLTAWGVSERSITGFSYVLNDILSLMFHINNDWSVPG